MATFKVKFIDAGGVTHEENIDGADRMAVLNDVKNKGNTLISLAETDGKKRFAFLQISFGGVKTKDKIFFARNLGSMIDAGLALSRALTVMQKQMKSKKFKAVITSVNAHISQGKTLAEAMAEFPKAFPQIMVSMVKAGEESGSLSQSLRVVAAQMENNYLLVRKIRGAMMYPGIVLSAMVIIAFFMLTFVVPTLSATFKELHADLPTSTKIVIGISDFLKNNIILSVVGIVGFIFLVYFGSKTKRGKRILDYVFLHLPVVGEITKEVNSARTARTLSSLLSAGVDVVVATRITRDVLQNSYYKEVIDVVEEKIQKGDPIAGIFSERENLYPAFVAEMIAVGEETGQLAQMLLGLAVFYENEVDQKTKDMSSIIEPFLMVFIGLAVGAFAISMISPIYSLGNNIN